MFGFLKINEPNPNKMKYLLISIFSLFFMSNAIAQLDKTERRLIKYVDEHNEQYLDLLKELININSGTMNFEGVRKVGDRLGKEFEKLGMTVE
jgi:glutamate carboxypeptidase